MRNELYIYQIILVFILGIILFIDAYTIGVGCHVTQLFLEDKNCYKDKDSHLWKTNDKVNPRSTEVKIRYGENKIVNNHNYTNINISIYQHSPKYFYKDLYVQYLCEDIMKKEINTDEFNFENIIVKAINLRNPSELTGNDDGWFYTIHGEPPYLTLNNYKCEYTINESCKEVNCENKIKEVNLNNYTVEFPKVDINKINVDYNEKEIIINNYNKYFEFTAVIYENFSNEIEEEDKSLICKQDCAKQGEHGEYKRLNSECICWWSVGALAQW